MTRVLVFTLIGFLFVVLMGSLQELFGMGMVVLDVPLIIVLYMAMSGPGTGLARRRPRSSLSGQGPDMAGGITGLLLGYTCDVLSGGIKGLHCFTLALMFLLFRRAASHVYLTGPFSSVVVTFFASLVAALVGLGIRWIAEVPPSLGSLMVVLAQAVLNAVAAHPLLKLLHFVDNKLSRESAERGGL